MGGVGEAGDIRALAEFGQRFVRSMLKGHEPVREPKRKIAQIRLLISAAERELAKFRPHPDAYEYDEHLGRAAEKIWAAFNLLVEYIAGREIREEKCLHPFAERLMTKSKKFEELYDIATSLHLYHYEGKRPYIFIVERIKRGIELLREFLRWNVNKAMKKAREVRGRRVEGRGEGGAANRGC
jgi:hypothetical protein